MKKNNQGNISKKAQSNQPKQSKIPFENTWHFNVVGLGIVVLLGILIYSNSFDCSFLLDDLQNIVRNTSLRDWSDFKTIYDKNDHSRFIPYLSFALNYHFGKLDVWGYHLFNLSVHLINSCLIWWLTLLLFSSPNLKNQPIARHKKAIAILSALLFVSHPLATQSVTYIVQRMASMVAMFYFLTVALYLYARLYDKSKAIKYTLFFAAFISAVFALLSKENAYTFPFAIVMVEVFFFQSNEWKISFKDYRVLMAIVGIISFVAFAFFKFSFSIFKPLPPDRYNDFVTITSTGYLFTQFSVLVKYIQLLFLPLNQTFDYDYAISNSFFELRTIFGFLIILGMMVLAIYLYKKYRILSFGIFWFFLTMAIESSFVPISDLIFEHRTYLPSFGFYLILSSGIYLLFWDRNRNIAISLFLIIITSNSFMAHSRNLAWKSEVTIWSDVILKSPNKARGYNFRAVQYNLENKYAEAIRDYKDAIKRSPLYFEPYSNLGNLLTKINKNDEAISYLNKAIEIDSTSPAAYNNRGNALKNTLRNEEAVRDYNKAIKLNPKFAEAYSNRGYLFTEQNKYDEALKDLNLAVELNPNYYFAFLNRGCLYNNMKKHDDAFLDFNKAIELKNDFADAYFNRGILELNMRRKDDACKDLQKALSLGFKKANELYSKYCH